MTGSRALQSARGLQENEVRQVDRREALGDLFVTSALQRSELEEDTNVWGLRSPKLSF